VVGEAVNRSIKKKEEAPKRNAEAGLERRVTRGRSYWVQVDWTQRKQDTGLSHLLSALQGAQEIESTG